MPSNVAAVCASFKLECLEAIHNLVSGGDTLKAALYYQGTGLGSGTTAYSATGEVSGAGYTAGGVTATNGTSPAVSGPAVFWTPTAAFQWAALTIASNVDCVLVYNASKANRAVAVFTFPAQTFSSATLELLMPVNGVGTGLVQVS